MDLEWPPSKPYPGYQFISLDSQTCSIYSLLRTMADSFLCHQLLAWSFNSILSRPLNITTLTVPLAWLSILLLRYCRCYPTNLNIVEKAGVLANPLIYNFPLNAAGSSNYRGSNLLGVISFVTYEWYPEGPRGGKVVLVSRGFVRLIVDNSGHPWNWSMY
jgi:hypothetical protein